MSEQRRDSARDEAAAWFARLGRRAVTTQELRDFRDWRALPANDDAYAELERTWRRAETLAGDPEIQAATAKVLDRGHVPRRAGRWAVPLGLGAVAAAAVALALAAPGLLAPAYDTGVGEQRLVVLEDGSRVRLNTDSRIQIRFTDGERRIALTRGQAFFEAAHDPNRPFVVDAGDTDVRALGTRFDVRRDAAQVQVTLIEGSVRVRREDGPGAWTLKPDQQLTVAPDRVTAATAADTASVTSWTAGRLIFHETPLAEAVAEVNRYAKQPVELQAPELARSPVNGAFDTGDTQAFAAAVSLLFGLEAVRRPDGSTVLQARGG